MAEPLKLTQEEIGALKFLLYQDLRLLNSTGGIEYGYFGTPKSGVSILLTAQTVPPDTYQAEAKRADLVERIIQNPKDGGGPKKRLEAAKMANPYSMSPSALNTAITVLSDNKMIDVYSVRRGQRMLIMPSGIDALIKGKHIKSPKGLGEYRAALEKFVLGGMKREAPAEPANEISSLTGRRFDGAKVQEAARIFQGDPRLSAFLKILLAKDTKEKAP